MPFSRTQLEVLKAAIASAGNAAEVGYSDGARIRYLTPTEASRLLDLMTADVNATESAAAAGNVSTRPVRAFRGTFSSGY